MEEFTTREAADRLGVTDRRVRALVATGGLSETRRIGGSLLIDADSVDRLARTSEARNRGGRPWSAAKAWAAIALLSGSSPQWISERDRAHLRENLRRLHVDELLAKCRRRADVEQFAGLDRVSACVIPTAGYALRSDTVAGRFGLAAGGGRWDGYCASDDRERVINELDLYPSSRHDHTLRVVEDSQWLETSAASDVLVALDLADATATRERSAGRRVLQEALNRV